MPHTADKTLSDVVDAAMRGITSIAHRAEGSYVKLPLLYPSGSGVLVRVSGGPDKYSITDIGIGYTEAELMGAGPTYVRQAKIVSQNSGVRFDEHSFFAVEVPRDRIPGAIVTVANCSSEAVALTAFKIAEKAAVDASEVLVQRLESAFGAANVVRHEKIIGASNHEWEFAAAIKRGRRPSLFEFATRHSNSVANVSMKMGDVALLEAAPRRIVMVHNKNEMGTYLGVLARSADVIEDNLTIGQLQKLADAA